MKAKDVMIARYEYIKETGSEPDFVLLSPDVYSSVYVDCLQLYIPPPTAIKQEDRLIKIFGMDVYLLKYGTNILRCGK